MGRKTIKGSSMIFLMLLLIFAIAFGSVATTFLNSTVFENDATPKYYSAVKDFSLVNNTADSQNVFSYEFALDSANPLWDYMTVVNWNEWYTGNTDYTHFNNLSYDEWAAKFKKDSFKNAAGISPKGRMRIWNRFGNLGLLDNVPAAALTYTAKEDGFINIPAHMVSVFNTYFTDGYDYKAKFRITQNGKNVYPQTGYCEVDYTVNAIEIPDVNVSVNKNDKIRFELTANVIPAASHSVGVDWNPTIYVSTETEHYTKSDDIYGNLTHFMESVFKNKESETMLVTDALSLANENTVKSKYGVYTPIDTVYSGGIIPSNDNTVWKYAVSSVPYGFNKTDTVYNLNLENTDSSTIISWENDNANGLKAVLVYTEGKKYTYLAPEGDTKLQIPLISNDAFVQLSSDYGTSEIIEFSAGNSIVIDEDLVYLDSSSKSGSGANTVYTLSNPYTNSTYTLRYSFESFTKSATAENGRSITANISNKEQMMFGFTAPISGNYELTAPIEVKNDKSVYYCILKEDKNGDIICVDGIRNSINDKTGYATILKLSAGETVWLNAFADESAKVCIGIPRVTLKEELMDGTYKYRAVDYIESSDFNNAVYKNISFTEETGSVWQFGSFENPIDGDNKDTLGYMNYSIGDDAKELKEHFKPYELLRYGKWYNPLAVVTKTDGNMGVTYDYGMVGVLHTTLGTAFSSTDKSHQNMGLPYQSKGFMVTVGSKTGRDDKIHNMGIYMKFIAPISGNMKLNLTDIAPISGGCKVMVLRNDCVFATYTKVALNTVVDFGFVNKGESIYICYGTNSDKVFYNYGGSPIVTISGERFNVTVGSKYNYSVAAGENIKLPLVSNKIGKTVLGWKGNTEIIYSPGENIVVENPESFASLESYYGDLTGDGYINATDISAMRKCIIDGVECILSVSDINTDGEFNAIDIVRMKKWLAGYTVAFNVG